MEVIFLNYNYAKTFMYPLFLIQPILATFNETTIAKAGNCIVFSPEVGKTASKRVKLYYRSLKNLPLYPCCCCLIANGVFCLRLGPIGLMALVEIRVY